LGSQGADLLAWAPDGTPCDWSGHDIIRSIDRKVIFMVTERDFVIEHSLLSVLTVLLTGVSHSLFIF